MTMIVSFTNGNNAIVLFTHSAVIPYLGDPMGGLGLLCIMTLWDGLGKTGFGRWTEAVLYNIDGLDVSFPVGRARDPDQTGSRFPGTRL